MGAPLFDASGPLELTDFAKLHLPEFDPLVSTTSKSSKCLIPPKTYQVQRDGWSRSARIWALSSPCPPRSLEKSASLITDGSPTFNPLAAVIRRSTSTLKEEASNDEFFGFRVIDPLVNLPTHYIKHISGKVYALFEGPGGDDEYSHSKKVMDFQAESCFGATSTYTQHSGSAQHAVMRKVKGINPWWSIQRTLEDFEGVRYSCKTEPWTGDITLTKLLDQVTVAKFVRAKFSWTGIGSLHILEPLQPEVLGLIMSATYIKYLCDRERRQRASSGG